MANVKLKLAGLEAVQLAAAGALFLSPWLLGFDDSGTAAWSAWLVAGAVALLASLVSVDEPDVAGWTTLGLGLWAMLAPVFLGFLAHAGATWSHLLTGAAVSVCAIAMLRLGVRAGNGKAGPAGIAVR